MADYFAELLNAAIPYIACIPIFLYPMWKTRDAKSRSVIIFLCFFTLLLSAALLFAKQNRTVDAQSIRFIMLSASLPANIMPFFVFRRRIWQNVFFQAVGFMYSPIAAGTGTYIAEKLFASPANQFLAASVIGLAVIIVTLPPLLFLLRRLYANPDIEHMTLWKFIWVIPIAFFAIIMISGNSFVFSNIHGIGFIIIRLLVYVTLLLICYLFELSIRQALEAETAKRRAESLEKDMELQRQLVAEIPPESLIVFGRLTLNTAKSQAFLKGVDLRLADKEFELLAFFIERENKVVNPAEIYQAIWKVPYVSTDHALKGCLQRLRRKIKDSGYIINNVRGEGFLFEKEV